jgi:hypothetical protein
MRKGLGRHNRRSAGGLQPSLVLDFAGTGVLDPRITFTRSTTATYYNSSGVLSTAAINAARFDYNPSTLAPLGLLIEQSSTNRILYSQDYSNGAWLKTQSTNTANTITAPDGTLTGSTMTALGTSFVLYSQNISALINGQNYTYSRYVKAGTKNFCTLGLQNLADAYFDLVNLTYSFTGTGAISASIQDVGNGWRKVSATWVWGSGVVYTVYMAMASSLSSLSGISVGDYQYVWGSQFENLTFPTSYIPTTTAQVTRAADNATMTGTNFSSWYNSAQGTFYIEYAHSAVGGNGRRVISVNSTINTSDFIDVLYGIGAIADGTYMTSTGVSGAINNNIITPRPTTFTKLGIAFANNDYQAYASGSSAGSDTSFLMPVNMNQMGIGCSPNGSNQMDGWIKKIAYYPSRLTNAQLQALTT